MKFLNRRARRIRGFLILSIIIFIVAYGGLKLISNITNFFGTDKVDFKRIGSIKYSSKNLRESKAFISHINKHVIKFEDNRLELFSIEGKKLWEKNLNIVDPMIIGNNSIIVIGDLETGNIYYLDYEGKEVGNFTVKGSIYDMKINEDGYILTLLKNESKLYLLNEKAKEVLSINIPKGEIVDGSISKDNQTISIVLLNAEEDGFYSNLLFYALDGRVLAGKKYGNEVIYKLIFTDSDGVIALSSKKIFMTNKESKIVWEREVEDHLNRAAYNNGKLALNIVKRKNIIIDTKNRSSVSIVDNEGKVLFKNPIADELEGLDIYKNQIVAHTDRTVFLIDDKGNIALEKKINKDIKDIGWIDDERLIIYYNDRVEIIKTTL